jgi:hypothetical protein
VSASALVAKALTTRGPRDLGRRRAAANATLPWPTPSWIAGVTLKPCTRCRRFTRNINIFHWAVMDRAVFAALPLFGMKPCSAAVLDAVPRPVDLGGVVFLACRSILAERSQIHQQTQELLPRPCPQFWAGKRSYATFAFWQNEAKFTSKSKVGVIGAVRERRGSCSRALCENGARLQRGVLATSCAKGLELRVRRRSSGTCHRAQGGAEGY